MILREILQIPEETVMDYFDFFASRCTLEPSGLIRTTE